MSKIQEALRKLQKDAKQPGSNGSAVPAGRRPLPKSVIPMVGKRKVSGSGVKYELGEDRLIRAGLLAPLEDAAPIADQFRRIKRAILDIAFGSEEKFRSNVVLVTSARPGVGKTFCSTNLAASLSLEREINVLLVDADVAKPHISRATGLHERAGLIDLLEDESTRIDDILVRTNLNDIQLLPAGRSHDQSTELLASDRMADTMHELAVRYPDRLIILDSPPLLATSHAQSLTKQVGQIVFVVESGVTTHEEVETALQMLDTEKPINAIFNKCIYSEAGDYYGGGYGFDGFNEEAK